MKEKEEHERVGREIKGDREEEMNRADTGCKLSFILVSHVSVTHVIQF